MNKQAASNRSRTWLRISGLLLGIVVLVWLPVEESSELGVLVVAGLICTLLGLWLLYKTESHAKHMVWRNVIIWGGMGLLLAPLAIFLMAIKTGIHGHGTPDFTADQMQAFISRMPFFILGGILLGTGLGLLRIAKRKESREEN